jgi:hypothetical protein
MKDYEVTPASLFELKADVCVFSFLLLLLVTRKRLHLTDSRYLPMVKLASLVSV